MQPASPTVSAPLVWIELITSDVARVSATFTSALGWKAQREPGYTDAIVYLDHARLAGPICGIRPRTPNDPIPEGAAAGGTDEWTVRLAPPRPPVAIDPLGDQLLRPRAPGPRIGRWAAPNAFCFVELHTPDVAGAQRWLERRLDAVVQPAAGAEGVLQLRSSVEPERTIGAVLQSADGEPAAGWVPVVQVASLAVASERLRQAGENVLTEREVPVGCEGTAALDVREQGGSRLTLIEHGPIHGRR